MMKTVKVLCRRFSVFSRTELRSISSVSPNTFHYHTQSLSSFSPTSLPHNFLHTFPNQSSKLFCSQSFSNSELRRCWNCNSSATTSDLFLVCNNCRCIQPVDPSIDYFRIFGLSHTFWELAYFCICAHLIMSIENNLFNDLPMSPTCTLWKAKHTCSSEDFLLRFHLVNMKLRGVHVDEEQTVSDPELLAEIMELRESVEEAPDSQALKHIQHEVQEKLKQWSERFAGALKKQDTEEALNVIRRMTYYKRANEEIVKRL